MDGILVTTVTDRAAFRTSGLPTLILACALALSACATVQQFERAQESWIGQPIEDYLSDTGLSPSEVFADGDERVYVFSFSREYQSPGRTTERAIGIEPVGGVPTTAYPYASVPIHQECTWTYRTSAEGIIRDFDYRGNACRQ
jgi:hypothetical protein